MLTPFIAATSSKERDDCDCNIDDDKKLSELLGGMKETRDNPGIKDICENDDIIRAFVVSLLSVNWR